ncbi:MAG TPA: hypothetical protein VFG64_07000 [Dongiaceae bacterium]|jgi:hypothetical protein|nr:hypothetical protein [Dongiaceae bacterium]
MSEYQADQEDTVLAYVRLKSGERPFNRFGEGAGFTRQAAKNKAAAAAKDKSRLGDNVIDLAAERARRAKRLK